MKGFWEKHFWDVIVVGTSAILASALSIYVAVPKSGGSHVAEITGSVTTTQRIDLSKISEETTVQIQGKYDVMVLGLKYNAICVKESNCPHHVCINQGWVSEANHPIICTYNEVQIVILGESVIDVNAQ
jgi:hypothetical protein